MVSNLLPLSAEAQAQKHPLHAIPSKNHQNPRMVSKGMVVKRQKALWPALVAYATLELDLLGYSGLEDDRTKQRILDIN